MNAIHNWNLRPSYPNIVKLLTNRQYNDIDKNICDRLIAAPSFIRRIELESVLEGHNGCVNCLEWSSNGRLLASSSDDYHVILWDPFQKKKILDFLTPHHGNVFSVKFMPYQESLIATGAGDCAIYVYDINVSTDIAPIWKCKCHDNRVKRLATVPDNPSLLWSSGEDGNIFQFDIREKHTCRKDDEIHLISLSHYISSLAEAKCIAVNGRRSEQLAVGANDVFARIYDRRMLTLQKSHNQFKENLNENCVTYFCPGHLNRFNDRKVDFSSKAITYLTFSPNGQELLVNMGAELIYLYDINHAKRPVYLSMPQFKHLDDDDCDSNVVMPMEVEQNVLAFDRKAKLPDDIETIKRTGNDFLENENYLQAVYQYTLAIQKNRNHPVFYLNRATAYMRRNWYGDVYAGLRDCQTALMLDPTYEKAHFRLTRALFELGYVNEAYECVQELRNRFPNHAKNKSVVMLLKEIEMQKKKSTENVDENENEDGGINLTPKELRWRGRALDYSERFVGHCNVTTDIKEANFIGNDGNYVIAGSDEGNFFIWERSTNMITNIYKGDRMIVNCVQPHPNHCMIATSGIDNEIRIWSPQSEDPKCEAQHRIEHHDSIVLGNQQRLQNNPMGDMTTICRSS